MSNSSSKPWLTSRLERLNSSPDELAATTRCVACSITSGTPSPSESVSAAATAEARINVKAALAANARNSLCRGATRIPEVDGARGIYGAYSTVFEASRGSTGRLSLAPDRSPPPWRNSFADDFTERHPSVDLRDADLDLVPDLRPRDEDHEVLDPRESVALPTDVLDLGLIDLPFLHGQVRRSEASARIRHPILHCGEPTSPSASHRVVPYITV